MDFDLYLLSLSWQPGFCCREGTAKGKKVKAKDQCRGQVQSKIILHGLWPSYSVKRTGGGAAYPQFCGNGKDEEKEARKREKMSGLECHQWAKHGTCSGLGPERYFAESRRLMMDSPSVLDIEALLRDRSVGGAVSTEELQQRVTETGVVSATPLCQLKEILLCFKKEEDGTVGGPIQCPAALLEKAAQQRQRCRSLVVDQPDKCQFVTSALKSVLAGSVSREKIPIQDTSL